MDNFGNYKEYAILIKMLADE